ncbi:MAG TPA: transcriptional regulator GcvA [Myxococcales bacterium]|jgi:LysR family glycine cleavage system transcriptional activator|nr:transcriptional regulator GcvA [Myxococcales bacterium]
MELPSLNALRAFEAAARHLSLTRAGRELHVTQSAISHQVRHLEEQLALELFERSPHALRLTPAGEKLALAAREAFARIAEAAQQIDRRPRPLSVSVLPSFGARWLLPRLKRFRSAVPGIDLRIHASVEPCDFSSDGVDVAIRYGGGGWNGLHVEKLLGEEVFPVCNPRIARSLRTVADLRRHVLLHDETRRPHGGWAEWLRAAGASGIDARRGTVFTDAHLMIQAAVEGQGVALARSVLVEGDLLSGRLVRPFDCAVPGRYHYFLVYPPAHGARAEVRAFREFLLDEVERPARQARKPRNPSKSNGSSAVRADP